MPRLDYLRGSSQATGWKPVLIAALITGPFIIGLAWFSVAMTPGPVHYYWGIWLLWPFAVAVTVAYVLWHRRPRRGRRAIEQGLAGLAAYLGGRLLPSPADTVDWLNRYWAAPSRTDEYYAGPRHSGAAGTAAGYPVMVDFERPGRPGGRRRARASARGITGAPTYRTGTSSSPAGCPGSLAGCTDRAAGPTTAVLW